MATKEERKGVNVVNEDDEQSIPLWHKELIESRIVDYEQNPGNTITWEELKSKIEAMKRE